MAEQKIVIRKLDDDDHSDHHGGGWKVAYADFMTALMAFFLLLWILAVADQEQLEGLAEFFTPTDTSVIFGGEGFLDGQVFGPDGVYAGIEGDSFQLHPESPGQEAPVTPPSETASDGEGGAEVTRNALAASPLDSLIDPLLDMQGAPLTDAAFLPDYRSETLTALEAAINAAVAANPALVEQDFNLRVERTPEGLLVQILDGENRPMFASGSARIDGTMEDLLRVIGLTLADLPYPLVITGHTDAVPFTTRTDYGNWELSADRANSARRALVSAGVASARIARVSGVADTMPLNAEVPTAPENRRLTMLLFYPDPAVDEALDLLTYPGIIQ